jgi:hypothetical protein
MAYEVVQNLHRVTDEKSASERYKPQVVRAREMISKEAPQ